MFPVSCWSSSQKVWCFFTLHFIYTKLYLFINKHKYPINNWNICNFQFGKTLRKFVIFFSQCVISSFTIMIRNPCNANLSSSISRPPFFATITVMVNAKPMLLAMGGDNPFAIYNPKIALWHTSRINKRNNYTMGKTCL